MKKKALSLRWGEGWVGEGLCTPCNLPLDPPRSNLPLDLNADETKVCGSHVNKTKL